MSELKHKKFPIVSGLDIGETKVVYVIGEIKPSGIEVIGKGEATHTGVRHGAIINIEQVSNSIAQAKDEAEIMSGTPSEGVWVSVSGKHIQSFDSFGMTPIRNKEIKKEDIDRVIDVARSIAIPSDRKVLHVLPKNYKIDTQEGIIDPLGMSGVRLESCVHIITGCSATLQNTVKCVERAGLKLKGMVLQQLASSEAILSEDEKALGVGLVDIGGGTCDMIVFDNGSVDQISMIPVGGQNFVQDLSLGLKTTQLNALDLLRKCGHALEEMVNPDESVEIESIGGRQSRTVSKVEICKIVGARAEETIELVKNWIAENKLEKKLGSGIVFTGGVSQLPGFLEMSDFLLDLPVRKGVPSLVGGMLDTVNTPEYSTVIGLLIYGSKSAPKRSAQIMEKPAYISGSSATWNRIKEFFTDVF